MNRLGSSKKKETREKKTRELIFQSSYSENQHALDKKLAFAPKKLRQQLLKGDKNNAETRTAGAIEIQRTWRGYRGRANIFDVLEPGISKTAVYTVSRHNREEEDFQKSPKEKSRALLRLEIHYQDYCKAQMKAGMPEDKLPTFEEWLVQYIQNWWRTMRRLREWRRKYRQAMHQKMLNERLRKAGNTNTLNGASTVIQRAWRRHIDIQVYKYYRDLINFKTRGNPSLMLRCINPQEAKMLDAASGIHIKFRLAGERFPPNIYYKIYTHRPIQDLCANSPKDYTMATVKLKMGKDQHNRGRFEVNPKSTEGWYQRMDNNGWRLVSDRLIHHIMSDPVTWETSRKKYEYHHDKLVRKQDLEKRKKKKKIDWMKKMYKDGMLKAKSDDKETIQLIEGAAAGMVATVENYGTDALEDWEVDELLDWTTSLNFDDYQTGWKELATSANSEKQIEDKMRLMTSTADPFEFTLSTGPSRYQSTQQSRNTPVSSVSSGGARVPAVS